MQSNTASGNMGAQTRWEQLISSEETYPDFSYCEQIPGDCHIHRLEYLGRCSRFYGYTELLPASFFSNFQRGKKISFFGGYMERRENQSEHTS